MYSKVLTLFGLVASAAAITGEASWYDAPNAVAVGACADKNPTIGAGQYGVALSTDIWDNTAHCGKVLSVTGPNGVTIQTVIIDRCMGCGPTKLDLLPEGFAQLGNLDTGIIPITWNWV